MLQLPVGGFLAVRNDLLASIDPFHGGGGAQIYFLGLEAASAGVEDDSGLEDMLPSVPDALLLYEGKGEGGRKEGKGRAEQRAVSEPLELAFFGVAMGGRWVEELDRIGGVEESTCFGVALAEGDEA